MPCLLDLTDRRLGATQFSTFIAATNGCEVWVVALAGVLVANAGYGAALAVMAQAGLGGLGFLVMLKNAKREFV
ncbi:MAG: hypothetical protein J6386_20925 [Candidatus Synoicihabitans palmerolidicus]|nr:hypothetical protein [Candidatus Synoicihabitans palmerolidicus]